MYRNLVVLQIVSVALSVMINIVNSRELNSIQLAHSGVENQKLLDDVIIDLKSKLYSSINNDRLLYTSNLSSDVVVNAHLHSAQMNSTTVNKYFTIVNETDVALVGDFSRQTICSEVKQCNKRPENSHLCLLDLSMILYMSNRQVKLVTLAIILNDLTDDHLRFERISYEFKVDPSISFEIGNDYSKKKVAFHNLE